METVSFQVTREHAAKLYRKYRSHCAYSTPMDDEIRRVYHQLSKGKTVIRALASIAAAGVDENGLPKLAITRADAQFCNLSLMPSGSASMTDYAGWYRSNMSRNRFFSFPDNTFPRRGGMCAPGRSCRISRRTSAPVAGWRTTISCGKPSGDKLRL